MKGLFRKIIPSNFNNLLSLAKKLILNKSAAARIAILYALLGLFAIPIDWLFQFFERRLYLKAAPPKYPLIFVCGPPRSGTTLVAQVLIKHLPVYYFNNLTSIFPNSPIIANKIFGPFIKRANQDITFKSFYGRTSKIWFPNDALYLWDRWTEVDRDEIPKNISLKNQNKMRRFFGAVEEFAGKPLLNKNNKLNTYAHLVAQILDKAYFICLDRNPVYLAQSQLIASRFIHSDESIPYGVKLNSSKTSLDGQVIDPIENLCQQVIKYKEVMLQQESLIGKGRFIIIPYEDFCAEPAKWVSKISDVILGYALDTKMLDKTLTPFRISKERKLDQETFSKIEKAFEKIGAIS